MEYGMPSRRCNGCGNIHPGPFWDNDCPAVSKKKDRDVTIIKFCTDLGEYLSRCEDPKKIMGEIKKLLKIT